MRPPIVPGDRYIFNYYWNGETWRETLIAPGYSESESGVAIDLAGSNARNLASAWWMSNGAGLEQYPTPLSVPMADVGSDEPMRLDVTSEPGGYVMYRSVPSDGYQAEIRMYQKISGDEQSSFNFTEGIEIADVAGLDYGRIAVMGKSGAARIIRQYERDAYNCVPDYLPDEDITLGGGIAMTGLPDGGYAVLMDTQLAVVDTDGNIKTFDLNTAYVQANCTPLFAKDLAAGKDGELYILFTTGASCGKPGATVMYFRDYGDNQVWREVDITQSPDWNGDNVSAIATHFSPTGLFAIEPVAYDPPLPDAPDGYTRMMPNAGDAEFVVDSQNGFDTASEPGWVWANAGRVYILPFLIIEADGYNGSNYVRWQEGRTTIYGHGDLYLHYDSLTEFPGDYLILSGEFEINLDTGTITPMVGAAVMLDVAPLGVVDAASDKFYLSILGMGEFEGLTPRTGIVVGGASTNTFGDLGAVEFDHLFMADLGGRFRITFGRLGYAGLLPPYVQATLTFGDTVPLKLVSRQDLFYTDHLELPAPTLEMLNGAGETVYTMKPRGVEMTADAISFDNLGSDDYFDKALILTIDGGVIGQGGHGIGLYGEYTEIAYAYHDEPLQTASFFAGPENWQIDALDNYYLGEVVALAENLILGITSEEACDNAWLAVGDTTLALANRAPGVYEGIVSDLIIYHDAAPTASNIVFRQQNTCILQAAGSGPYVAAKTGFTVNGFSFDNGSVALSMPGGLITTNGVEFNANVPVAMWNSEWKSSSAVFNQNGMNASSIAFDTTGENNAGVKVSLKDFKIDAIDVSCQGGSFNHYGYDWTVNAKTGMTDWTLGTKMTDVNDFDDLAGSVEISSNALNIITLVLPEYHRIVGGGIHIFALLDHEYEGADEDGIHFDGDFQFFILPTTDLSDTDIKFNDGEYIIAAGLVPPEKTVMPPGMGTQFGPIVPPMQAMGGIVYLHEMSLVFFDDLSTALGTLNIASGGEVDTFFAQAPYLLNALGEMEFNSGLGYQRVAAGIYLLDEYSLGDAQVIWGNVYVDKDYLGYGLWAKGYATLKKVVDCWVTIARLRDKPDEGNYTNQVELKGMVKIPIYVPYIGGVNLAGVTLRMFSEAHPTIPTMTISRFEGVVNLPLCVKYPYCKVKWCKKWKIKYPCGMKCEIRKSCVNFDIGLSFSPSGIDVVRSKAEQELADAGMRIFTDGYGYYDTVSGISVMTNYRKLDVAKTLATDAVLSKNKAGQQVISFEVPDGVPRAVARYDYTPYEGDVTMSIRFPDGTVFTPDMTNPLQIGGEEGDEPVEGDWSIEYTATETVGETLEESLREAAYTFQGQWKYKQVELMEEPGVPTGETVEELAPDYVMPGHYEIIINATGDADQGAVEFLLENNPPELINGDIVQIDEDTWHIEWEVEDQDEDDVIVKLYLGADPDAPQLATPIGAVEGYLWEGVRAGMDFSFQDYSDYGFAEPQYLFIGLDDGYAEHYLDMTMIVPPNVPQPPVQVEGVVARAGQGGADVFWDPVVYEPPTTEFGLGGYVIQVVEHGADGATEPSRTLDAPADTTEIYVDNLINGRIYDITVAAYAMRKDESKADGDPESFATYPGAKSSPVTVQPVATLPDKDGVMNPPRFITSPPPVAIIGEPFEYEIGIEQLDGTACNSFFGKL